METLAARELSVFEEEIAELFDQKQVPAVTHLCGEAYQELVDIFKCIQPEDWVLGTWRSHCHCLLKGVPKDELRAAILAGRSVALSFPRQRVLCSFCLVGGRVRAVAIHAGSGTGAGTGICADTRRQPAQNDRRQ